MNESLAYLEPLLDKKELAEHYATSVRSIERAMSAGLPCVEAFGKVKFQLSETGPWLDANGYFRRKGERGQA